MSPGGATSFEYRCYPPCHCTSNVDRVYAFQVGLPSAATGLERDSKAQAEQIRSVAVERIGARLGTIPDAILRDLDEAIRLHLGM